MVGAPEAALVDDDDQRVAKDAGYHAHHYKHQRRYVKLKQNVIELVDSVLGGVGILLEKMRHSLIHCSVQT